MITVENLQEHTEQIANNIHSQYVEREPMENWLVGNVIPGLQSITVVEDYGDTVAVIESGVDWKTQSFKTEVTLYNKDQNQQYDNDHNLISELLLDDNAFIDHAEVLLPLLEDHMQVMSSVQVAMNVENIVGNWN